MTENEKNSESYVIYENQQDIASVLSAYFLTYARTLRSGNVLKRPQKK